MIGPFFPVRLTQWWCTWKWCFKKRSSLVNFSDLYKIVIVKFTEVVLFAHSFRERGSRCFSRIPVRKTCVMSGNRVCKDRGNWGAWYSFKSENCSRRTMVHFPTESLNVSVKIVPGSLTDVFLPVRDELAKVVQSRRCFRPSRLRQRLPRISRAFFRGLFKMLL